MSESATAVVSKPSKLEVYSKAGRKYMVVRVGTDVLPANADDIEAAKESLKEMIEATSKEFKWVFVPHTIGTIEALIFDNFR